MKNLTNEQASTLRELRPLTGPCMESVDRISEALAGACPHEGIEDGCRVCRLYETIREAAEPLWRFCQELDAELVQGPMPRNAR